jgi:hypothetical protein
MTEPLTPPDCDLRGLPFMPLDVVRLGDSDLAALSTGDEFKASVLLWCKSWLQVPAASLPDDDRVLAHLTGLGPNWKKVKAMALKGWIKCTDGRLYHPVVAEKAREAWKHRQAQRERANKRWQSRDDGSTNTTGDATAYAAGDATALPRDMQGTGTVKGEGKEREKPSPAELVKSLKPSLCENPPSGITDAATALNYVCNEARWRPASDTQRQSALSIINGWLALGCTLEFILAGIAQAQRSDPSPTRSLKRFDSTIRGKLRDQLGCDLPHTSADVRFLADSLAKRMAV